jgi:hypothetical protein
MIKVVLRGPSGQFLAFGQHRRQFELLEVMLQQHGALGGAHGQTSVSSDW